MSSQSIADSHSTWHFLRSGVDLQRWSSASRDSSRKIEIPISVAGGSALKWPFRQAPRVLMRRSGHHSTWFARWFGRAIAAALGAERNRIGSGTSVAAAGLADGDSEPPIGIRGEGRHHRRVAQGAQETTTFDPRCKARHVPEAVLGTDEGRDVRTLPAALMMSANSAMSLPAISTHPGGFGRQARVEGDCNSCPMSSDRWLLGNGVVISNRWVISSIQRHRCSCATLAEAPPGRRLGGSRGACIATWTPTEQPGVQPPP